MFCATVKVGAFWRFCLIGTIGLRKAETVRFFTGSRFGALTFEVGRVIISGKRLKIERRLILTAQTRREGFGRLNFGAID